MYVLLNVWTALLRSGPSALVHTAADSELTRRGCSQVGPTKTATLLWFCTNVRAMRVPEYVRHAYAYVYVQNGTYEYRHVFYVAGLAVRENSTCGRSVGW